MTVQLEIHPQNPQERLIRQAVEIVHAGGVVAYPTDSGYALGCSIGNKEGLERIRCIRALGPDHNFTLICRDLSESATYANFDDRVYNHSRTNTPGTYTFILRATKEVPRRLLHPKRKTIGLRVPDHRITLALLAELDEPMMSTTLILPGEEQPLSEAIEIRCTSSEPGGSRHRRRVLPGRSDHGGGPHRGNTAGAARGKGRPGAVPVGLPRVRPCDRPWLRPRRFVPRRASLVALARLGPAIDPIETESPCSSTASPKTSRPP